MVRQNIILGKYTYIADYYKADIDKDYVPVYKKFVMVKNSNIMNNVIYDTDVYFIEESLINECMNSDGSVDTEKLSQYIAYPVNNSKLSGYSTDYKEFNDNFSTNSFVYGNDIQKLYNNKYEEQAIKCDKFCVYLPTNNSSLTAIVCVKAYINNIQFYFVCRPINQYEIHSETEFTVENTNYSEYVEIYIPSISTLFAHNSIYSIENSNVNEIKQQFNYTTDEGVVSMFISLAPVITKNAKEQYFVENKLKFSISTLTMENVNFRLYSKSNGFDKSYTTTYTHILVSKEKLYNNLLTYDEFINSIIDANPDAHITINCSKNTSTYELVITALYDTSLGEYTINLGPHADLTDELTKNCAMLNYDTSSLVNVSDFEDLYLEAYGKTNILDISWSKYSNKINIVELQTMTLPFAIMPVTDLSGVNYKRVFIDTNKTFESNYETSNIVIVLYPYENIVNNRYELTQGLDLNSDVFNTTLDFSLAANFSFSTSKSDLGKLVVRSIFKYPNIGFNTVWDAYCYYNHVTNLDYTNWDVDENEIYEDFYNNTNIEKVGYRIEIATDKNFKNIIYAYDVNIDMSNSESSCISDFDFSIDNIFGTWEEKPELLVIHTAFIDKVLTNIIISNDIVLTKDKYKYIISDSYERRVISLPDMQADPTLIKTQDDTMDLTKFNFIDKISCTVNKTETTNTVGKTNNTPKILYKPIFYKVADLQTLKIREGVSQNIGINLSDLMTKVETFKLVIEGTQYVEYARNDVYVIFAVNSTDFSSANGTYSITNQDDEFISSGSWYLY